MAIGILKQKQNKLATGMAFFDASVALLHKQTEYFAEGMKISDKFKLQDGIKCMDNALYSFSTGIRTLHKKGETPI